MESDYPENEGVGRKESASSLNTEGIHPNSAESANRAASNASDDESKNATTPPVNAGPTDTQRLRNFLRRYKKELLTRPSRLRATAFYGVLRVIGWIGMIGCIGGIFLMSILTKEIQEVYDSLIERKAKDVMEEQILVDWFSELKEGTEWKEKDKEETLKKFCKAEYTYAEFKGQIRSGLLLGIILFYLLAFLSRRIIRRNFYILRIERAVQDYLIP